MAAKKKATGKRKLTISQKRAQGVIGQKRSSASVAREQSGIMRNLKKQAKKGRAPKNPGAKGGSSYVSGLKTSG